jgi:hypothetical protein
MDVTLVDNITLGCGILGVRQQSVPPGEVQCRAVIAVKKMPAPSLPLPK